MMRLDNPPRWRKLSKRERAAWEAGDLSNDAGGWPDVTEEDGRLYMLTGDALDCGCIPHHTYQTGFGFHCATENQGYCNFECPHDDDDDGEL